MTWKAWWCTVFLFAYFLANAAFAIPTTDDDSTCSFSSLSDVENSGVGNSPRKPAAATKKRHGNAGRRGKNPHGNNPNRKKIKVNELPSPARVGGGAHGDPALDLHGNLQDVWGIRRQDGYVYWSWEKFTAWESHNWLKLTKIQQVAMKMIRTIMEDPEVWQSEYTERHHMIPTSSGGNPKFSPEWCVSLTYANHLLVHVCYALVFDHQDNLHRGVGMCMLGFPKDNIELEEILRSAGAPDGIAERVAEFKQRANVSRSQSMLLGTTMSAASRAKISAKLIGNQHGKGHTVTAEHRAKISDANKLRHKNRKMLEALTGLPPPSASGMFGPGHQTARKWKPYQDQILAELTVKYPKGSACVDWKKLVTDPLFRSLPDWCQKFHFDKRGSKVYVAKSHVANIKSPECKNSLYKKGDWEKMQAKARKKLRANFLQPSKPTKQSKDPHAATASSKPHATTTALRNSDVARSATANKLHGAHNAFLSEQKEKDGSRADTTLDEYDDVMDVDHTNLGGSSTAVSSKPTASSSSTRSDVNLSGVNHRGISTATSSNLRSVTTMPASSKSRITPSNSRHITMGTSGGDVTTVASRTTSGVERVVKNQKEHDVVDLHDSDDDEMEGGGDDDSSSSNDFPFFTSSKNLMKKALLDNRVKVKRGKDARKRESLRWL